MPTRSYIRFWCSKCQEFTIQNVGEEGACTICGTITKTYKLSEVSEEKLIAQRERYNNKRKSYILKQLSTYVKPSSASYNFFDEVGSNVDIVEDDAGQKDIDEINRKEREERLKAKQELKEEYQLFYKKLGRNDKCACGSGNKYKNCCLSKFSFC